MTACFRAIEILNRDKSEKNDPEQIAVLEEQYVFSTNNHHFNLAQF